jgi:hypothetical protein
MRERADQLRTEPYHHRAGQPGTGTAKSPQRALAWIGAPRSTKMGNTRSLWRYDVGACVAPPQLKPRQLTIPRYECRRYPASPRTRASPRRQLQRLIKVRSGRATRSRTHSASRDVCRSTPIRGVNWCDQGSSPVVQFRKLRLAISIDAQHRLVPIAPWQ